MPIAAFSPLLGHDDPLSRMIAPPRDETEPERQARIEAEAEAKRISDAIDEELQREEKGRRKAGRPTKILLLGQSESGKSTTLKNFQLMNSPKAFRTERGCWRAVIQLNVVRSIRVILEAMSEVQNAQTSQPPSVNARPLSSRSPIVPSPAPPPPDMPRLTPDHLKLKMRLLPLLQVEESLIRKLTPAGSAEYEATHLAQITNIVPTREKTKEVAVNSQFPWKGVLSRLVSNARGSMESSVVDFDEPDDPGRVIHACGEDMVRLWTDPTVRKILDLQRLRLEDMPGFFLDCLDRVTSPHYMPSDADILRARLKTLGVTEYKFQVKDSNRFGIGGSSDWRIYDVGGQRSSVTAWAPFFDDIDAILFLAPISCFDQVLAEEPEVNRVEDSILLWKSVVSNPLLAKAGMVLFLNKIDILKAKLQAGVRVAAYIPSFGNRPNDFETTSNYLKRNFIQIHKEHSPAQRPFYCHLTDVTNTQETSQILVDVQDNIIRRALVSSKLVA